MTTSFIREREQWEWSFLLIISSRRHDGEGGRVLFRKAVEDRLLPLLTAFKPDLIIMSSGTCGVSSLR